MRVGEVDKLQDAVIPSKPTAVRDVRRPNLINLQYLRALSACAIVLYHSGSRSGVLINIGEGRVALFFLVSGFIFWWITAGRAVTGVLFFAQRAARLVPLYWLATTVAATASWLGLSSHDPVTLAHYLTSMAFVPHSGPISGRVLPVVFPGWTMVYEMFFCILFALALYLPERRRLAFLSVILGGLPLLGWIIRPHGAILKTYTDPVLVEFVAGVWIAHVWPRRPAVRPMYALALAAGLVISLLAARWHDVGPELLIAAPPSALIMIGALGLEKIGAPQWRALKTLGDASYSIYLWHVPSFYLSGRLLGLARINAAPAVIGFETLFGIGCGLILYFLIEKPMGERLGAMIGARRKTRSARSLAPEAETSTRGSRPPPALARPAP